MIRYTISLIAILLSLSTTSSYASLFIDINDVSANTAAVTQGGFTNITRTGGSGIVAPDVGTVNVSFSQVVGGAIDDRDRGALNPAQPLSNLLRDILFTQTNLPAQGTLDTTISGINAGTYLFTGYFHDVTVNHISGNMQLSVDGGTTFPLELQDVLFSFTNNPPDVGRGSVAFTADGINNVVMRLIGTGGTTGFTSETALLSGFVIEPFTELGDFNRVGGVTTDDFFILSGNLGNTSVANFIGHAGGDINLDGVVDLDDFGQFKALFPMVVAEAMGVPEPSTVSLFMFVAIGGLIMVHRRSSAIE